MFAVFAEIPRKWHLVTISGKGTDGMDYQMIGIQIWTRDQNHLQHVITNTTFTTTTTEIEALLGVYDTYQ